MKHSYSRNSRTRSLSGPDGSSSPIVPLVLALLARCTASTAGPLAHGGRTDRAARRLALVRRGREVVPEVLLALVQRRLGPRAAANRTSPLVALRALDEFVEALQRRLGARLRRLREAAAEGPRLGCKVGLAELRENRSAIVASRRFR